MIEAAGKKIYIDSGGVPGAPPDARIHDVDLAAVKKKMKDKAFARAVNREEIMRGAEQLGMPLDEVITNVIAAT